MTLGDSHGWPAAHPGGEAPSTFPTTGTGVCTVSLGDPAAHPHSHPELLLQHQHRAQAGTAFLEQGWWGRGGPAIPPPPTLMTKVRAFSRVLRGWSSWARGGLS